MEILDALKDLGISGFSIFILWKMFIHYSDCMAAANANSLKLEKEIRDTIMNQLNKNTVAFDQISKHFAEHEAYQRRANRTIR